MDPSKKARRNRIISIAGGIGIAVVVVGVTVGCLVANAKKMPFESGYNVQLRATPGGTTNLSSVNPGNATHMHLSFRYDDQGPQWSHTNLSAATLNKTVDLKLTFAWLQGNKVIQSYSTIINRGTFSAETATFGETIDYSFDLLKIFPNLVNASTPQQIRLDCYDVQHGCWIILGEHNFCYFFNYINQGEPENGTPSA